MAQPENTKNLKIASIADIACMKLSAITSRATNKDYIDLYFILQNLPLPDLLKLASKKMPEIDKNILLKSLVYFKDIEKEKIKFRPGNKVAFRQVEKYLEQEVKKYKKI